MDDLVAWWQAAAVAVDRAVGTHGGRCTASVPGARVEVCDAPRAAWWELRAHGIAPGLCTAETRCACHFAWDTATDACVDARPVAGGAATLRSELSGCVPATVADVSPGARAVTLRLDRVAWEPRGESQVATSIAPDPRGPVVVVTLRTSGAYIRRGTCRRRRLHHLAWELVVFGVREATEGELPF